MTSEREWLNSLKPGDKVAVVRGFDIGEGAWVRTVDRVTKTMIIVDGVKYRRLSGLEITSDPRGQWLESVYRSAHRIYQTKLRSAQSKVRDRVCSTHLKSTTLDQCERILAILNESEVA